MAQAQIISLTDLQRSKMSINQTKKFGNTKEFAVLSKTEYANVKDLLCV
ncbi:MAG: hypothetical protein LBD75_04135 [Candidatus Peribacteria bacterium]|jgi:hypothetical protein|nr:hypothetical protein [Candidatus Peribacteria bacterium]